MYNHSLYIHPVHKMVLLFLLFETCYRRLCTACFTFFYSFFSLTDGTSKLGILYNLYNTVKTRIFFIHKSKKGLTHLLLTKVPKINRTSQIRKLLSFISMIRKHFNPLVYSNSRLTYLNMARDSQSNSLIFA